MSGILVIEMNEVANWLLLSYKSEQKQVKDKLDLFERKYNISFSVFEMERYYSFHWQD